MQNVGLPCLSSQSQVPIRLQSLPVNLSSTGGDGPNGVSLDEALNEVRTRVYDLDDSCGGAMVGES